MRKLLLLTSLIFATQNLMAETFSDVRVTSPGKAGKVVVTNENNAGVIVIEGVHSSGTAQVSAGGKGVPGRVRVATGEGKGVIILNGADGIVHAQGIKIVGGSDLAESFPFVGYQKPDVGHIVSIDVDEPGALRVSDEPYDRKVAGVVSGANQLHAGIVMNKELRDFDNPTVALTGRVYCWADASFGEIQPGDLLTTSTTPGHAMKVSEHEEARGAIIGKAMSTLTEGKGLVYMLVSLQ